MAYISASKSPLLKPTVFSNLSRLSTTHFKSLRLFSSESSLESLQETPDQQPPIPQTDTQNEESVAVADANPNPNPNPSPVLPMGKHRNPDALLMEGKRQNDKEIFDFKNRISEMRKSLIVEKRLPMGPSEGDSRFMYEVKRAEARLLNPETKGDPDGAKTYLEFDIEIGGYPQPSTYRVVMEVCLEDGRIQTASRIMKIMVEKDIKLHYLDVKEHMDLFAKILEALLMRGHVEEALGRIDLLIRGGCAPDFDSLLSVLSEKGKTIAAVKLVDFCLERDYNVDFSSYDKVLDALLADGKTLDAYSILCKIKEKGGVTDQSICKELIKILNEEGNTKQADILSRMFMGKEKGVGGSKKGKK